MFGKKITFALQKQARLACNFEYEAIQNPGKADDKHTDLTFAPPVFAESRRRSDRLHCCKASFW